MTMKKIKLKKLNRVSYVRVAYVAGFQNKTAQLILRWVILVNNIYRAYKIAPIKLQKVGLDWKC